MLKDKNSGGITITHGGGNLREEPGNNSDKDCHHDCDHYCSKGYYRDHYRSCYSECSYVCVEPVNSYVVLPSETFEIISTKLFGNTSDSANIATIDNMPVDAALAPARHKYSLPSIKACKTAS